MSEYYCEFCLIAMTEEDHHFSDICGECMEVEEKEVKEWVES